MTRTLALATLSFAITASVIHVTAAPAETGTPCANRDLLVKRLEERHGETLSGVGLSMSGILEVYASPKTGTWTILVTRTDGSACMIASGKSWESVPAEKPGDPT